jgi:hypothetical protein
MSSLFPDKATFENFVLDRVSAALVESGVTVTTTTKGDSDEVPFDWLLETEGGSCIGLEVVRAEDESQVGHLEREYRNGEVVITGTAEMPWDSVARAVEKKQAKADRYRDALSSLCPDSKLHLGITSGGQDLEFQGELGEHLAKVAADVLASFDVVWLVQGEFLQRLDAPRT